MGLGPRLRHWLNRLRERLWLRPLAYCLLAVAAALAALAADLVMLPIVPPDIAVGTTEKLLTVISSTMLAVATFAVGSMISAYASASRSATPRAFELIIADDMSKTALSSFIGAFIFSIVALVALDTGGYERNGRFALFLMTLALFAWVILTFLRWTDGIARLGRLGETIDKTEAATAAALRRRRRDPRLGGRPVSGGPDAPGDRVECDAYGYVQSVDMLALQRLAKRIGRDIRLEALPGVFLAPGRPAARLLGDGGPPDDDTRRALSRAFIVGNRRTFEEDPRFGLIVLAEIGDRALSPAVNDPGTAIVVVGRFARLFAGWSSLGAKADGDDPDVEPKVRFDRVEAPELSTAEMFDDAFGALARDGAGMVEVGIRLQKALLAIACLPDPALTREARRHSREALQRAEAALTLEADLQRVRDLSDKVAAAAERQG